MSGQRHFINYTQLIGEITRVKLQIRHMLKFGSLSFEVGQK